MESNEKMIRFPQAESSFNEIQSSRIKKSLLLARKIEAAMRQKQYNRQQFAAIMGVQPSIVTRWLSGNHNFTVETLFEIEENLDVQLIAIERPANLEMNYRMVVGSEPIQHTNSLFVKTLSDVMPAHITYCTRNIPMNNEDCDDSLSIFRALQDGR